MNIPQNTYYNQQPMMPPQPRMPIRQRMTKGILKIRNVFPKWLTQYSIVAYILTLMLVSFMFLEYSLPWYYMLSGVAAVLVSFLYGGYLIDRKLSIENVRQDRNFERKIFWMAFIPRILFMLLLYWIFQDNYHDAFGFENGDANFYNEMGTIMARALGDGTFAKEVEGNLNVLDLSDMGYGIYLGFIYWLTGDSIIIVRLLKCLFSSITVILIYRLTKRNFDPQTARVAAIFCALWPNFWYYCAVHLKEVEMVFLCVLFVEQADQMLRSRQFTSWKVIPVLLIASALFTLRTPLGIVAILALILSVVMSSTKVVNWGKRIIVGGLAIVLIGVVAGNQIEERALGLVEQVQDDYQKDHMEWRSNRIDAGGNKQSFARYAGAAVFAPMIFTLPFPSMARPFEGQDVQQLLNGGNFVKNIMSCFTIFAMIMLLMSGRWRDHLLPLSFMLGYLVVLALSSFAQSERFHQPVLPLEFMFAAYGLSIAVTKPKYKRWFTYWCGLMFVACIAWNWFKMAGRGLA